MRTPVAFADAGIDDRESDFKYVRVERCRVKRETARDSLDTAKRVQLSPLVVQVTEIHHCSRS